MGEDLKQSRLLDKQPKIRAITAEITTLLVDSLDAS